MANKAPNGKDRVICKLVGEDGNAFAIMGRVRGAMRKAKWTPEEIKQYTDAAMKGDYNHLLSVTMEYADEPDEDSDDEFADDSEGEDEE